MAERSPPSNFRALAAMAACLLPVAVLLLFARGQPSGNSPWLTIAAVVVFAAVHVWLMRKGHCGLPGASQHTPRQAGKRASTTEGGVEHGNHAPRG